MRERSPAYDVGHRIVIVAPGHPHRNERGTIVAPATGGPASVGLHWEVQLEDCPQRVDGCFVSTDEIRREHRG